jgi:hypothetical protein
VETPQGRCKKATKTYRISMGRSTMEKKFQRIPVGQKPARTQ